MSRIIAFVLRAGGAVGGAFAGLQMPPDVLLDLLADFGIGVEAGLTAAMAGIALAALGGIFGFLLGSAIAGILPDELAEPVGTREEAAASVPRLRRHLSENHGQPRRTGSPLERLSAPPAGQQLPKHDLSHIPPAPKDDEITFDRIPNTGFYADIESPVQFHEDDDDLARFATRENDTAACGGEVDAPASDEWPASMEGPVSDEWDDAGWGGASPAHGTDTPEVELEFPTPVARTAPANMKPASRLDQDDASADEYTGPAFDADDRARASEAEREPSDNATARIYPLQRDLGHDGHSAPRFSPGLTGGMDSDWFAGEADEEEDADDDGAGYGSLMAIGLGKTHKPRAQATAHRPGEANLSPMPLIDIDRDRQIIPNGAGPQDFRLREALEELKRV